MKFSRHAFLVMMASVIAHLIAVPLMLPWWVLGLVNFVCLALLSRKAGECHRKRTAGFDVIVAAETIVAFGIMSLILGLGVALYPLISDISKVEISGASLRQIGMPFLVGLATAGVAPFLAMLLRNQSVEDDAIVDPVGDATDLTKAMGALRAELGEVRNAMELLQERAQSAAAATGSFTDVVETETSRLKLVLLEGQSDLRAFGAAAQGGAQEVERLAGETGRLSGATSDTAKLMEALAALIAAVERFVAPATASARR